MSADNGVYILRTVRNSREVSPGHWQNGDKHYVWRVAYANAIDNFDYFRDNQFYNLGSYMKDVWGRSPIFLSKEEAFENAKIIHTDHGWTEYGIGSIDTDYVFYGDM